LIAVKLVQEEALDSLVDISCGHIMLHLTYPFLRGSRGHDRMVIGQKPNHNWKKLKILYTMYNVPSKYEKNWNLSPLF
jgi:hypothetical protein